MEIIKVRRSDGRREIDTGAYAVYLESIRDALPPGAQEFAEAAWHYDFFDERCPHDMSLLDLVLTGPPLPEASPGGPPPALTIRLLGSRRSGTLRLVYPQLRRFRLDPDSDESGQTRLGEVVADEVRLSDGGSVIHEIAFADATLVVESGDIRVTWISSASDASPA
jgi:hypothetical protein